MGINHVPQPPKQDRDSVGWADVFGFLRSLPSLTPCPSWTSSSARHQSASTSRRQLQSYAKCSKRTSRRHWSILAEPKTRSSPVKQACLASKPAITLQGMLTSCFDHSGSSLSFSSADKKRWIWILTPFSQTCCSLFSTSRMKHSNV